MAAATPSPTPGNLIMLAVLGIGVYWFMTRRAGAAPLAIYPTPQQNQQSGISSADVLKWTTINSAINKGLSWAMQSVSGGYSWTGAGTAANPYDAVGADGVPYNPVAGSAFDELYNSNRSLGD